MEVEELVFDIKFDVMEVLLDVENIVFEFEFKVFVVVELVVEEVFVVV